MEKTLKQIRWLFVLAIGFIIFGVVGVLFKIILLPYTLFQQQTLEKQKQARRIVTKSWKWFIAYLDWANIATVHFEGADKLGKPGQLILANHPSLLDVVFLLANTQESNCLVKSDLLRKQSMNSQIKACGYILNNGNPNILDNIHQVLSKESLVIFPEGTRTNSNGKIKFHRGAAAIALRSAKEIIPIVITTNSQAFKKGQKWYHIPNKKIIYHFKVGEPIDPKAWLAEKTLPVAARKLNDYLEQYFQKRIST